MHKSGKTGHGRACVLCACWPEHHGGSSGPTVDPQLSAFVETVSNYDFLLVAQRSLLLHEKPDWPASERVRSESPASSGVEGDRDPIIRFAFGQQKGGVGG